MFPGTGLNQQRQSAAHESDTHVAFSAEPSGAQQHQVPSPAPCPLSQPPSPAPITQPYQSQRTLSLGHPSVSIFTPSSSQPFLGFNTLAPSMAGQVNQQRLASSASSQPRQPRLPSRTRRRGPAVHPPSLPRAARVDDCRMSIVDSNSREVAGLRVKVKVYPPPVSVVVWLTAHDILMVLSRSCSVIKLLPIGSCGSRSMQNLKHIVSCIPTSFL
jgi:hypothetical protein